MNASPTPALMKAYDHGKVSEVGVINEISSLKTFESAKERNCVEFDYSFISKCLTGFPSIDS